MIVQGSASLMITLVFLALGPYTTPSRLECQPCCLVQPEYPVKLPWSSFDLGTLTCAEPDPLVSPLNLIWASHFLRISLRSRVSQGAQKAKVCEVSQRFFKAVHLRSNSQGCCRTLQFSHFKYCYN